jgi:hypothetical protein
MEIPGIFGKEGRYACMGADLMCVAKKPRTYIIVIQQQVDQLKEI